MTRKNPRRRFLIPEVVQTSAMDCGPASLKSLVEGHGIPVSYERLRDACQTDVDGTSIDTLEDLACQLGLDARQIMCPADFVFSASSAALPALAVTRSPGGDAHFVVVWRRVGAWVQVMDPARGRRWVRAQELEPDLYQLEHPVPREAWVSYATSSSFRGPLLERLQGLGLGSWGKRRLETAMEGEDSLELAALDAAARFAAKLVAAKSLGRGREVRELLAGLLPENEPISREVLELLPERFWTARPQPGDADTVLLRGALLVTVSGRLTAEERPPAPPDLTRALDSKPVLVWRELFARLRERGSMTVSALLLAVAAAALATGMEALLLRSVLELGGDLALVPQRLQAALVFGVFASAVLLMEVGMRGALLRLGRRLELQLRLAFQRAVPHLPAAYFRTRPISDLASRCHAIHEARGIPSTALELLGAVASIVVTAGALIWVFPTGAWLAIAAATAAVAIPYLFSPNFGERDLKVRVHSGALSRFYLDALLGLAAVRAHTAERVMRGAHEGLLVKWCRASRALVRTSVMQDALQAVFGYGFAFLLLYRYADHAGDPPGALLVAYWALLLPTFGEQIATLARRLLQQKNLSLRLLELLHAPWDDSGEEITPEQPENGSLRLACSGLHVVAGGQSLLSELDLQIAAGEHVAIVGSSGAGKSTLIGLLLGSQSVARGTLQLDGKPATPARLEALRRATVWVDPAVALWNRSLFDNVAYGNEAHEASALTRAIADAHLIEVLAKLDDGLQTELGEGGGLLSGGEGQRVRLARGLAHSGARLVLFDEPFRGLGRGPRSELLASARRRWQGTTLIFASHDIEDTRGFDRVLVMEQGRIVEDGRPGELQQDASSLYARLLAGQERVHELFADESWRRLVVGEGQVREAAALGSSA